MKKITFCFSAFLLLRVPLLNKGLKYYIFFLSAFCFLLSPFMTQAQNTLVINLNGNPSEKIPFSNIQKITFDAENMLLKTNTGTNSYPFDNIKSITFLDDVGVKEVEGVTGVNVYVNSLGEIVVESPHPITQLTVFDITGKQVAWSTQNKMNVNYFNTGIYILQVVTEKGVVNKKFMKN